MGTRTVEAGLLLLLSLLLVATLSQTVLEPALSRARDIAVLISPDHILAPAGTSIAAR